ncbi:MAG TPA: trypsin-like serine protease [Solirubrobacterales bacterium]|nr:trypsin-like serine protease [Solirubrobacterales bacterium]
MRRGKCGAVATTLATLVVMATASTSHAIVGGTAVTSGWPWAVFVVSQSGTECSGTLISDRVVVTSAPCAGAGSDLFVSPDRVVNFEAGTFIAVTDVEVIEGYDPDDPETPSLAKLSLEAPIPGASPIDVIASSEAAEVTGEGASGLAAGYGLTSSAGTDSGTLREGKFTEFFLEPGCTTDQLWFCTETGPPWVCYGDLGAPLVVQLGADTVTSSPAPENGEWRLAGIVMGGDSECGQFSFFANLLDLEQRKFVQEAVTPETTIFAGPDPKTSKRRSKWEFRSSIEPATFKCSLDDKRFKACASPYKTKRLSPGRHTFEVKATADGVVDPTPARASWKILK